MSWSNRYIDVPFKEGGRSLEGCDCGGLVWLIMKQEAGVCITDFQDYGLKEFTSPSGFASLGRGVDSVMDEWLVVDKPKALDLVRFRVGRAPCHVGIYVGQGWFIHSEKEYIFSRLARLNEPAWQRRFIEFRRHRDLCKEAAHAA